MFHNFVGLPTLFLKLPRRIKVAAAVFIDINICLLSTWLAYFLRINEFVRFSTSFGAAFGTSVCLLLIIFYFSGFYRSIFRHNSYAAFSALSLAIALYGLIYFGIVTILGISGVPRTIGIIQPLLVLILTIGSRVLVSFCFRKVSKISLQEKKIPKVIIYGAGTAGRSLAAAISSSQEMKLVGFLDDNKDLQGHFLNSTPIYNPENLFSLVETLGVTDVLLAMPNIERKRRNDIIIEIQACKVFVRILPSLSDLANGRVSVSDLRELDVLDLLERQTVLPNETLLKKNILDKVVLVTGAGGSIGAELCRQIILLRPKKLLLVEQNEFALYNIHQELEIKKIDLELIPLLASVQDTHRMNEIMSTWPPDTVYHAAAYKHVPLVEHNLAEGLKNNFLGTLVMAKLAITHGVNNFVLISTDKAVRPTNIMGASKRLAEMILQALAERNSSVKFSMVRFGNVLGSSGSVVPKFRQQIRAGGPITITHPKITRFFMTISEASQLVIQAGAMARGGDVFVLDMGKPIKIMDLAKRMIELSGLSLKNEQNPAGDIEIEITKLRPGEKLYEELLIGNNPETTSHPKIMKAHEAFVDWEQLQDRINIMTDALHANDVDVIRRLVDELVPDYQPNHEIVDWVYAEQEHGNITSK